MYCVNIMGLLLTSECSAKTRSGVIDIFQEVVRKILAQPGLYESLPLRQNTGAINVGDDTVEGGWSGCAC